MSLVYYSINFSKDCIIISYVMTYKIRANLSLISRKIVICTAKIITDVLKAVMKATRLIPLAPNAIPNSDEIEIMMNSVLVMYKSTLQ